MTTKGLLRFTFLCGFLVLPVPVRAQGAAPAAWPGWRGPGRRAFSPEVPQKMPAKRLLWRRPMAGESHAGVAVAAGYVIVSDHDNERDYYRCYDAEKGTPVWVHAYGNAAEMDYGAAPRATPLIDGGKVFCLNALGDLFCLDLETGKVVWQKNFGRDFNGGDVPMWGYCSSPLVAGGALIVNPGGVGTALVALNPDTGEVVWKAGGGPANYSSFIAGTFGGVEQVVGYGGDSLGGWDLKTGRLLWSLEVGSSGGYIVPTPVSIGAKILLTDSERYTRQYGFDEAGRIVRPPEAENEDLYPEMSTPTVLSDTLLGASEGLVCLDLKDGLKTLWIYEDDASLFGVVHVVASADRALVFCDDGHFLLVAADRKACKVLGKMKVCGGTWSHPALAGGRLYVRDRQALYCYDLKATGPSGAEPSTKDQSEKRPAARPASFEREFPLPSPDGPDGIGLTRPARGRSNAAGPPVSGRR